MTEFRDPTLTAAEAKTEANPAPAAPAPKQSIFDRLREDYDEYVTQDRAAEKTTWLAVPGRPDWEIEYSTRLSIDDWQTLQARARNDVLGTDVGQLLPSVLVNQCSGVKFQGELVTDAAGQPVTFRSAELQAVLGKAFSPEVATKNLYLDEMDLAAAAGAVLTACGIDRTLPPTQR